MPIPRAIGRWNKVGLNRVTRRIAPWMPGFGVVVHRGGRSGRLYRTPEVGRCQGLAAVPAGPTPGRRS